MLRLPLLGIAATLLFAIHSLAQSAPPAAPAAAPVKQVNLNTASSAELQTLPGIGERTAARIIEFREKNGPFKKIEELMNVQGIGEKSFLRIRAQLTVGPKPADPAAQK